MHVHAVSAERTIRLMYAVVRPLKGSALGSMETGVQSSSNWRGGGGGTMNGGGGAAVWEVMVSTPT